MAYSNCRLLLQGRLLGTQLLETSGVWGSGELGRKVPQVCPEVFLSVWITVCHIKSTYI